jgi:hypothetical protein
MRRSRETLSPLPSRGKQPQRNHRPATTQSVSSEEILIVDARAHLTPAQMVERKLMGLIETLPLAYVRSALSARGR